MCAACAMTRPSASNTAQEASRRSLMLGEYAARMSVIPISSAAARSSFWRTSTVTRSMPASVSPDLERHLAQAVDGEAYAVTRRRKLGGDAAARHHDHPAAEHAA